MSVPCFKNLEGDLLFGLAYQEYLECLARSDHMPADRLFHRASPDLLFARHSCREILNELLHQSSDRNQLFCS